MARPRFELPSAKEPTPRGATRWLLYAVVALAVALVAFYFLHLMENVWQRAGIEFF